LLQTDFQKVLIREQELMENYGFTAPEMHHIIKNKPTFVLYEEDYKEKNTGIIMLKELLCDEMGFSLDTVKTLIVKYPFVIGKTKADMQKYFQILATYHTSKKDAMDFLLKCPKLLSIDLEANLKEIIFMFELYHQMSELETLKIFRAFPFLACSNERKLQRYLGEFRKYKLTPKQISNYCINSGGLLGSQVENFVGLFTTMRKTVGCSAREVIAILDVLPEFALQNRKDMLKKKYQLIQQVSGRDDIYMRNFIKRHPDIIMK
jgi:hypothetical protein